MGKTVAIGYQDFSMLRQGDYFYIDKTDFIREWWAGGDQVTLIARPRRFGKTLNMSMLEYFFSIEHAGKSGLFEGLSIWEKEEYRMLQGTYPVISISFANVKETTFEKTFERICQLLSGLYTKFNYLKESDQLLDSDVEYMEKVQRENIRETEAALALYRLSDYLFRYYKKRVIILLDEYDTPMQEAYINGYWEELVSFTRNLFHATFKTNPCLARAVMTGITRVSRESMFSDLNNLKVITTTSNEYAKSFGFTEEEVFAALDECGMPEQKQEVKNWYDGFTFGNTSDIYNPWSVINFLDTGKFDAYWVNTSSNGLVNKLVREGSGEVKKIFEDLLEGKPLIVPVDEQIVYNLLDTDESSIWSLLLASGYLRVQSHEAKKSVYGGWEELYELVITNFETRRMFCRMFRGWFQGAASSYNDFIRALLSEDVDAMNEYMNRVACATFSYFDTGKNPSGKSEPERFYHGFVLGLMVELADRYVITSNRESGFGRYDILLKPRERGENAYLIEFKVHNPRKEKTLEDTVEAALGQIREKKYEIGLVEEGIPKERIKKYGFAFQGQTVQIGGEEDS